MGKLVVTGHSGFIGRNLCAHLDELTRDYHVLPRGTTASEAQSLLADAQAVIHLAGVNRPISEEEFDSGNVGYTRWLCEQLEVSSSRAAVVFASSIQANLDNPYGRSKKAAEGVLREYASNSGNRIAILRLKNVFGKWCKPDYNSVVATFCHNVAAGLPISISNPDQAIDFVYVDDVVTSLLEAVRVMQEKQDFSGVIESHSISLGNLAATIQAFSDLPSRLVLPDFSTPLTRYLYATFLTFKSQGEWSYELDQKSDARGTLAEFIKSDGLGQIFVSKTVPGATRGNHYHHTKTEKFLVLSGQALIQMRAISDPSSVIDLRVSGDRWTVVDIPPGYTHAITNTGDSELTTLFWASEPFNPEAPDTYGLTVLDSAVVGQD